MTDEQPFGVWLRERILDRGLAVRATPGALGINRGTLRMWLNGSVYPNPRHRAQLAAYLGVSLEEIAHAGARRHEARTGAEHPFAPWLRDRLAERQLSADALARRLLLNPLTVRAWLHSKNRPQSIRYVRLAEALEVTIDELRRALGGTIDGQ